MKTALALSLVLGALTAADDSVRPGVGSAPTPATVGAPSAVPFHEWKSRPTEPFGEPEKSFRAAFDVLKQSYVDAGLTEADLWHAATQGLLEHAGERPYDTLLAPAELAEISGSLGGEIVGIGIELRFDDETGMGIVQGIIPGGAAEKGGLLPGDAILKVDGKVFRGKQYRDVVAAIRGKEGDPVTLSLLREASVITKTLKRGKVTILSVSDSVVSGDVGVLAIKTFHEKTPALLREAAARLQKRNIKALVIDLRNCPGGHFEKVLEGAGLLLPKGAPIVTLVKRGGAEETFKADGGPLFAAGLPIAVLVNEKTASGGEILAGALQANGALVTGKKTHGKWNVQMIDTLPNKWAIKFTTGIFKSPKGEMLDGVGLLPDIEVEMDKDAQEAAMRASGDARLTADAQLRVAVNALRR